MIAPDLLEVLRTEFVLDWEGPHGLRHWTRVRDNGLRLARHTGAQVEVVELFAFVHDVKRLNEGTDPEHGARAARFVRAQAGKTILLPPAALELLVVAVRDHSLGRTEAEVTVATCWDADRLDLGRIGSRPDPRRLCTDAARDPGMIEWAFRRSLEDRPLGEP